MLATPTIARDVQRREKEKNHMVSCFILHVHIFHGASSSQKNGADHCAAQSLGIVRQPSK
jgi:hypothetical protein